MLNILRQIIIYPIWLFSLLYLSGCSEIDNKTDDINKFYKEKLILTAVNFDQLPGWKNDSHGEAIVAFLKSCERILTFSKNRNIGTKDIIVKAGDWNDACLAAKLAKTNAKEFFQKYFTPFLVSNSKKGEKGLFTGYFEAELKGSKTKSSAYPYALYSKPNDLVKVNLGNFTKELSGKSIVGHVQNGRLTPYPTRKTIEAGHLNNKNVEMLWINDAVDLFLLQVQGSGRVILEDGSVIRVGFAAHNGRAYKSIGRALINWGEIKEHQASWNGIKNWIANNPDRAAELFAVNPRFIFFKQIFGDGPIGAQNVALTPTRSMAIDKKYIPLGVPRWLDTVKPGGSTAPLQRLLIAQDTGGAIKGMVRGDFFWGYGNEALKYAGVMKSSGRYFILLPKVINNTYF